MAALLTMAVPASAQSLCVTCTQPQASYSCDVEGWSKLQSLRKGSSLAQMACITDIAKRYGHGECRVREGYVGSCMGARHVVSLKAAPTTAPPQAGAAPPVAPGGQQPPAPTVAKNQPPRTVVEMAGNAAKDTERQIEKAGKAVEKTTKAVGGAVSKTWRCIVSLFSNC